MAIARSIESMADGLHAAITKEDWPKAHRHIERLKAIILDGVARNDPVAIQSAGSALQSSGQLLELSKRLRMEANDLALAWQLRADTATALLAQRVRPISGDELDRTEDLSSLLLKVIRESNAPITNRQLAERTGKDPATISRTLKQLKAAGRIERWRSGPRVYNKVRSRFDQASSEIQNIYALAVNRMMKPSAECAPENIPPREEQSSKDELVNRSKALIETF